MLRYFFNIVDGDDRICDYEGLGLPRFAATRDVARGASPDMARGKLTDGDRRALSVQVRDGNETLDYSAIFDLAGRGKFPR